MHIGILALQGAVEPHRVKFAQLGVEARPVRKPEELASCAGLVLPGGESTTLLKLIGAYHLRESLEQFASTRPVWGVCAGAILMSAEVVDPTQESLGLMPVRIQRNGYGRQNESFVTELDFRYPGESPKKQEGVFIRAPKVQQVGEGVVTLARHNELPVALLFNHHLLTTFHPELSPESSLHEFFGDLVQRADQQRQAS